MTKIKEPFFTHNLLNPKSNLIYSVFILKRDFKVSVPY